MNYTMEQYQASAQAIRSRLGEFVPKVAMVLGSGLGYLGDEVENPIAIDYKDIPHFKSSTAPGHKGRLVFGMLEGQKVAVMQGRMHHYEGYSYEEVSYGVRVLRLLGCDTLIVTNAAGCVNTQWEAGDLMLITDRSSSFPSLPCGGKTSPPLGTASPTPPTSTPCACSSWPARRPRSWTSPCGKGSISTATAPSMKPPRRCGRPGFWEETRWACPPLRRSLWPATAAWRYWV